MTGDQFNIALSIFFVPYILAGTFVSIGVLLKE